MQKPGEREQQPSGESERGTQRAEPAAREPGLRIGGERQRRQLLSGSRSLGTDIIFDGASPREHRAEFGGNTERSNGFRDGAKP